MAKYLIAIRCSQKYDLSFYENCRDLIRDCKQAQMLMVEAESPPMIPEIDRMNKRYKIPDCSQTGCERFLSSTTIQPLDQTLKNESFFTIDDLTER